MADDGAVVGLGVTSCNVASSRDPRPKPSPWGCPLGLTSSPRPRGGGGLYRPGSRPLPAAARDARRPARLSRTQSGGVPVWYANPPSFFVTPASRGAWRASLRNGAGKPGLAGHVARQGATPGGTSSDLLPVTRLANLASDKWPLIRRVPPGPPPHALRVDITALCPRPSLRSGTWPGEEGGSPSRVSDRGFGFGRCWSPSRGGCRRSASPPSRKASAGSPSPRALLLPARQRDEIPQRGLME